MPRAYAWSLEMVYSFIYNCFAKYAKNDVMIVMQIAEYL